MKTAEGHSPPSRPGARLTLRLVVAGLVTLAGLAVAATVTLRLPNRTSDMLDPGSASARAYDRVAAATGADPREGYAVLTDSRPAAIALAERMLTAQPLVAGVHTALSRDGSTALVAADLAGRPTEPQVARLRTAVRRQPALGPHRLLGGATVLDTEALESIRRDLLVGELVGDAFLIGLLLLAFRGVRAALVCAAGGVFAVGVAAGLLGAVSLAVPVSGFAINLLAGLGLGLATDFSLLIVTRFREELARHDVATAARLTRASAGRTVLFSTVTVSAAMAATLVYPERFVVSMGLAGILAALSAGAFALLVLPAILRKLGTRIGAVGAGASGTSGTPSASAAASYGGWRRVGAAVIRRPGLIVTGAVAVLLMLASPLAGLRLTGYDATTLPRHLPSVQVYRQVDRDFPDVGINSAMMVTGSPGTARRAAGVEGVAAVRTQRLDARTWAVQAVLRNPALSDEALRTVRGLRRIEPLTTGTSAALLDARASLGRHLPAAAVILTAVLLLAFFALTGSVVLPVKALMLNVLTLTAAFGIVQAAFPRGVETHIVVLLTAVALGLSIDYGIFLLARVKEMRDSGLDTAEAITGGLAASGRTITMAALIVSTAIVGMSFGAVEANRQLGVGLVAAVLIDATVVRALLVPGSMTLLGRYNWWAPAPLRRLHRRSGAAGWHEVPQQEEAGPARARPEAAPTR